MNKTEANSAWNVDLFCQVYSQSPGYMIDTLLNFYHALLVYADPCWSRLVYMDQAYGEGSRLRAWGQFGGGLDSLDEPMGVKVISPTSDENPVSPYYYIYVADRQNHRVERLHYHWPTPDSGLIHDFYCNATMWQPTDLDVSVGGSFTNEWGYETWVACKNDKIYAFNYGGAQILSYGSTGSGVGHFTDIRAIVCGKTRFNQSTGVWFANNNYVYVLDAGNNRIVRLSRSGYYTLQWDMALESSFCGKFTDLEVDACGHVWATSDIGVIFKFTKDLAVLGTFGSEGTGPNQFDYPVSIANTGGHLGGGDMMICENWTAQSGLQHYAIGTDVNNLFVNPKDMGGGICYSDISFVLADPCAVIINIYNSSGTLVRHLYNNTMISGTQLGLWNGTNDSQQSVAWGNYRVDVTASSLYKNSSGEPVNTVTKSADFTLCESECQCGDANSDHSIDISDPVFLINFIFSGGAAPADCGYPQGKGDANGDGEIDISDAVYLISYIFSGGAAPHCQ
ncbi:MAG: dockerin type I domain-containing protein [candidate division Zixibacteria bacterium]|nr:dockerin type I domain-containing protein [candidate division Zixibacteria bacterium]